MRFFGSTMRAVCGVAAAALVLAACGDRAGTPTDEEAPPPSEDDGNGSASDGDADEPDEAADGEERVLKVGLLNPVTGVFAALGSDTNTGFEMYVEERGGSLSGWTIEIVKEDDEGDPTAASQRVRKLVDQDEVDFLIGGVSSAVAYGIADFVADSGVPYLITIAGADGLTQNEARDNIFRISYTGSQPMHPLGEHTCLELGYKTASLISLDFAFGWETAGGFARTYEEAGCELLQEIYVPLGTEDYAPFVQQLDRDAEVVIHINSGPSGNLFWQTYRDFGYSQPVVGHGAITDEFLLQNDELWQEGALTVFYWSRALDSEANRTFVQAFEDRAGSLVSQGAEAGYAAAIVLEAALAIAGDDARDPSALLAAMAEVEVDAPRGRVSFDDHNQAVMDFYLRETQAIDEDPFGNASVTMSNVVVDTFPGVSQFWTFGADNFLAGTPYAELKGTWAN